jgi:hypothetical protein
MKKNVKKLTLNREALSALDAERLMGIVGGQLLRARPTNRPRPVGQGLRPTGQTLRHAGSGLAELPPVLCGPLLTPV